MSRSTALLRLQQIDQELDARRARRRAIEAELNQDASVASARAALAAAQSVLSEQRKASRELEAEVAAVAAKSAEVEAALYGGRISNPKELKDLQDELASLKRRRSSIEDKLLDAMMQVESGEADEETARARLAEAEAALQKTHGALAAEKQAVETLLDKLALDREAAETPVPQADRELYLSLRQRKRGLAVVRLEDGACGACGVAPSSSRAQTVRQANELIRCGNCERILCAE